MRMCLRLSNIFKKLTVFPRGNGWEEEQKGKKRNGFSGFIRLLVFLASLGLNLNCEECSALEEERVFRVQGW